MAATKKVNWSLNAMLMLGELFDYLEEQIGDVKTIEYIDNLMDFGNTLDSESTHFSFCRNKKLQAAGYRCATFRKKYILIFKEKTKAVDILGVLHVKRGPGAFEELLD